MSDTTESGSANSRARRSKRDFIDANGVVVDKMEQASGARYTLLGTGHPPFDAQFGPAGDVATMMAIFGWHTKIGNVANTVFNDRDNPGDADQAADAVDEFIGMLESGQWTEPSKGGAAAKIDRDVLALVVAESLEAKGKTVDVVAIRQKLDDDRKFFAAVRSNKELDDEYNRRMGTKPKAPKSVDDIAAML